MTISKRLFAIAALAVAATLAASCATAWFGGPGASSGDQIRIPHARHAQAKIECLACHEAVYDAKTLGPRVTPDEKKCLQCHSEQKQTCSTCHTAVKKRLDMPMKEVSIRMSHADHIERVKENCSVCHKQLPEPFRGETTKPTMSACLTCHEHQQEFNEGRCLGCHVDLARYPLKPVSSFSHAGNYVKDHMRAARSAPETCASCHDQTFCADCHAKTVSSRLEIKFPERVDRDFIHRDDYVSRHAIDAKADPVTCARCHGVSFCESCHTAQNLTPRGSNPRNPHPVGWALPGSPQFHGAEARRDIASCASCHDQGAASNCVGCHKVGGIGGNPHPSGFSQRHPREEISHNGMCAACH